METATMTALEAFSGPLPADIYEISYARDVLRVRVSPRRAGAAVVFRHPVGFRFLDEGDLPEFWPDDAGDPGSWIYEVRSGGWKDLESGRTGFLSADRAELKEFLVATMNGCLNVLSVHEPESAASAA